MDSIANRLGAVGTVIVTVIVAVVVNLIIYAIGSAAGATYEFTNNDDLLRVEGITLVGFTALPLLIGLTATAFMSRKWGWVIPTALVVAPLAAIGTIFTMTIPSDLDTTSKVALAAAHVALGIVAAVGILGLRSLSTRQAWQR